MKDLYKGHLYHVVVTWNNKSDGTPRIEVFNMVEVFANSTHFYCDDYAEFCRIIKYEDVEDIRKVLSYSLDRHNLNKIIEVLRMKPQPYIKTVYNVVQNMEALKKAVGITTTNYYLSNDEYSEDELYETDIYGEGKVVFHEIYKGENEKTNKEFYH